MPNQTHNYLLANTPHSTICFSVKTGTTSVYFGGAGGVTGDGFPLPRRGYLTALTLWDGSIVKSDSGKISFDSGDRLSVYCQNMGTDFTVKVRLNGTSYPLQVTSVPHNSTLQAVVELLLVRE